MRGGEVALGAEVSDSFSAPVSFEANTSRLDDGATWQWVATLGSLGLGK
jgi:hypothetical protein